MFIYTGRAHPVLAVLLLAPLLLLFFFVAAVALVGGALGALLLPLVLRRHRRPDPGAGECVTLEPHEYSHVGSDGRRLPHGTADDRDASARP